MTLQEEARVFATDWCIGGSEAFKLYHRLADALDAAEAENKRLRGAIAAYRDYLHKSVNVGPLTKNPTKEAKLLRQMFDCAAMEEEPPPAGGTDRRGPRPTREG